MIAGFQTVPVLMYHHVSPTSDMITTTPEHFESQMAWLSRSGYTTLDAERFAGFLRGEAVPERSVLLTFDDGYLDNWVYAHPVLHKYGLKALLFLITGQIGQGPARPHVGDCVGLPPTPGHRDCEAAVAAGSADDVMLRWSEVHAMRKAGTFEFHSHTHTHTRWDKQFAAEPERKMEALRNDLLASQSCLREELGECSDHLCWPQGYFDDDYVQLAQDVGFRHLYTTDPKGQNVAGTSPLHIHRFAVKDEGGDWLQRRLWLTRSRLLGPAYHQLRYRKRRR